MRVYTARLTYTFPQDTAQSGADFMAPRGAADVLRLAYPELHADQRNAILKATALDSGYPLWQSSDGWQRINWAKALCARVTLDKHGDVAKVETADQVALAGPSVVNAQYIDAGNHPASDSSAGENSAIAAGSTQIQEPASAVIQPKFSRAAHRCGDTEQHRPDRRARCDCGRAADHCRTEHGCQTIRNHQRGLCRQYESCRRPG